MNKPMMIQDERLEKCKAQLAEAQADNAEIVEALKAILPFIAEGEFGKPLNYSFWTDELKQAWAKCQNALFTPHPGAALLQEVEQLRKVRDEVEKAITACDNHKTWSMDGMRKALSQAKAGEQHG